MNIVVPSSPIETSIGSFDQEGFIQKLADGLRADGYCVLTSTLPHKLSQILLRAIDEKQPSALRRAAVGRQENKSLELDVRRDRIEWLDTNTEAGVAWLTWMNEVRQALNRELLLGLFSFESHFARYGPGDFYKRHRDAFQGQANRILSVVTYLNPDWSDDDGGELVMYSDDTDKVLCKVAPKLGTMVFFLSEEFPHEVLPAAKPRWSIAGWFRVNTSRAGVIDPPT